MTLTFRDILDQIEAASLDTAEKGNRFERLVQAYLLKDPKYSQFSDVWLWSEYPDRGNRIDFGVDLVARDASTGELTAIQCKFLDPARKVPKSEVDSFLAASSKAEFADRMIVSTADEWSSQAEKIIEAQDPPVTRLGAGDFEQSPIDWSEFSLEQPEELVLREKHDPRPHQKEAIEDVIEGFEEADRGKLIMACGTGKTFTALRIAEQVVPEGGTVLFLVPSISLLSQTVTEWTAQSHRPLQSFAVCSDVSVGKRKKTEDISVTDLAFPATTDGKRLAEKFAQIKSEKDGMRVVFSTYQSIEAVAQAQKDGIPEFDLIIADEAHRTTGVTLEDDEESAFVRVHDQDFIKGKKRLYMTATPRIYGERAQSKAKEVGAVLADMGDSSLFGEEFHHLTFAKAVEQKVLTDYKVLVLAVDEGHVSRHLQGFLASDEHELNLEDAAKLVGCWNGLSKRANDALEFEVDPEPMKRAVAFSGTIKNSKTVAHSFNEVVEAEVEGTIGRNDALLCDVQHVDGTQNALVRNKALDWLRQEPPEGECRILSNARCLSEGVDVPALDAVLFLAPRKSQIDVVQSVGRVMRKLEGKQYGYVILPVAIPADTEPEEALANNKKYQVVWQVLQALRSHDDRLDAIINKLDLTGDSKGKISIIGVGGGEDDDQDRDKTEPKQVAIPFPELDEWRDAILAKIVKKVGDRQYWENWARDIAQIAQAHIQRITDLVDGSDAKLKKEFDKFLDGLRDNLNPYLSQQEAIEMLAQHLITQPVFDALFRDYSFSESNPVSLVMQQMLDALEPERLEKEQKELDDFYRSVRLRAADIDDPKAKQEIVKDLYETFFRLAFPATADKLGIVYTPVEIVDFILNSADEALREHFGVGLTDEDVHILDPFTGTGTFIVRLIQSGLIEPKDLERKFRQELHANEVVLLAYYVAAINIEEAYHAQEGGDYEPFEGIVLTDTFQMHEGDDKDELPGMEVFPENNERVVRQKEQPIRVIIGNPPYSAGQSSADDDNQNLKYEDLDGRIEKTYATNSNAQAKHRLYDSYIRAFRWASDRIGDRGLICFVSNGGFLESGSTDGMRKCLVEEFSEISIFNLRGNARTSGEVRRKEAGNVFGGGTRTAVVITLLVKNPEATGQRALRYRDIGDYLSRDDKLRAIEAAGSVEGLSPERLQPNEEGDWLNQRSANFPKYQPLALGEKDRQGQNPVFTVVSHGLATNRDAWAYNFSSEALGQNTKRTIDFFNKEVERMARHEEAGTEFTEETDPKSFSWSRGARQRLRRADRIVFNPTAVSVAAYRPFCKERVYFDPALNEVISQLNRIFPQEGGGNLGFYCIGRGTSAPFSLLMLNELPDLNFLTAGQFFPRFTYRNSSDADNLLDLASNEESGTRLDNVTDETLEEYQGQFGSQVSKDEIFFYVYGLLHSPVYRERFRADLMKLLPRIPKVEDFMGFSEAGRKLSELHVGYEGVDPYSLSIEQPLDPDFRVKKMKFAGRGKEKDRSTIIYNDQITVSGIPEEAYRYQLGSRSAIEWIMDRYQVKTDKASGIVNDPNDWATEHDDPSYILDLLCRIVTVSVETMKIVDSLPPLEIIEEAEIVKS